jgi:hypothetical protein
MIVRQLKPWGAGWNTQGNALAQMRRDMETLMERLTGVTGDGSVAGLFPPDVRVGGLGSLLCACFDPRD